MSSPDDRERVRRMRIRLAALKRHAAARDESGKSALAVAGGKASGLAREGDKAFGLELALKRWHPEESKNGKSTVLAVDGADDKSPGKDDYAATRF